MRTNLVLTFIFIIKFTFHIKQYLGSVINLNAWDFYVFLLFWYIKFCNLFIIRGLSLVAYNLKVSIKSLIVEAYISSFT